MGKQSDYIKELIKYTKEGCHIIDGKMPKDRVIGYLETILTRVEMLETENESIKNWNACEEDDYKKLTELAKLKAMGKLVEVVYCEECKKIMTSDCPMCSFDIDGFCTGGPDNDGYCFLGER